MAMLNNEMVIKPGYMLYINVIWNWEYIQYDIYTWLLSYMKPQVKLLLIANKCIMQYHEKFIYSFKLSNIHMVYYIIETVYKLYNYVIAIWIAK